VPFCRYDRDIERHANSEEKQSHEQTTEWLDIALDLVTVARTREHHPGEESSHRHREAGSIHQQRCTENHQQRAGCHDFADPCLCQQCEEGVQEPA
jgi:hypothetical protein